MKKPALISTLVVFILVIGAAGAMAYRNRTAPNPDPNHTHADFAVYVLGTKLDFSADEYMSEAPAAAFIPNLLIEQAAAHDEGTATPNPKRQYLHLHDGNGNVIHRHKPGLTLGAFFDSIGLTMTKSCLTLDAHQYELIPAGEKDSYALTPKLCNTGKFRWQMFVNAEEVTFDPGYVFNDLDRILLTYDAGDMDVQNFDKLVTDEACMYSKTCPGRGNPPTENCIADPEVPCVIPE